MGPFECCQSLFTEKFVNGENMNRTMNVELVRERRKTILKARQMRYRSYRSIETIPSFYQSLYPGGAIASKKPQIYIFAIFAPQTKRW